jgi:hypothetical protein
LADQKQKAVQRFISTQNLSHYIWTFDAQTFSLADIILSERERCAEIAWEMQRAEGRSEIGNAINGG